MQKIVIGSDHGGFELKEYLKEHLAKKGIDVCDIGVCDKTAVDYPDIAQAVCEKVLATAGTRGVLVCGTGIGISIAANKINGIRAALCGDAYSATMATVHNNANVIALGGRVLGCDAAAHILDSWLSARFESGRHQARVDKIMKLEGN